MTLLRTKWSVRRLHRARFTPTTATGMFVRVVIGITSVVGHILRADLTIYSLLVPAVRSHDPLTVLLGNVLLKHIILAPTTLPYGTLL